MNQRAGKVDGSGVRPPRRQAAPRVLAEPMLAERLAAEVPDAARTVAQLLAAVYDVVVRNRGLIDTEMASAVLAVIQKQREG